MDWVLIAAIIAIAGLLFLLWAISVYVPVNLWIACKISGFSFALKGDIPLTFDQAVALQRQGHDVFQAMRMKIEPRTDGLSYSTREMEALKALDQTIAQNNLV